MCRLLGIIANKSVDCTFSMPRFNLLAVGNPDGWGCGWYEEGKLGLEKIPLSATHERSKGSIDYALRKRSHIFIAHVRLKGSAPKALENTHPFSCKEWLFAHNGMSGIGALREKIAPDLRALIEGKNGFRSPVLLAHPQHSSCWRRHGWYSDSAKALG